VEIKSGYGLDEENELKMLRAARRLGAAAGVRVKTSFLGAHALPKEFEGRPDAFIDTISAMMPKVAESGLADAVDAFCETIAFTPEQTARVFKAAQAAGLPVKLHADQLSDLGGAALAAAFGGLSADHLEYTNDEGLAAMARGGTVAVLLPGAFYFLRETKLPPVEACRRHGVAMALASDSNPGSSPTCSLLLMLNMAATLFRMTPEEAVSGVTRHAAQALGMAETHGTLAVGKTADLAAWSVERPGELAYRFGFNPLYGVLRGGSWYPAGIA